MSRKKMTALDRDELVEFMLSASDGNADVPITAEFARKIARVLRAAKKDRGLIEWLESTEHSSIEFCPQMEGGIWIWEGASLDGESDDYKGRLYRGGLREFYRAAMSASKRKR